MTISSSSSSSSSTTFSAPAAAAIPALTSFASLPAELLLQTAVALPLSDLAALCAASQRTHSVLAPTLYRRGLQERDDESLTGLHRAARYNSIAGAALLLARAAELSILPDSVRGALDCTALHMAAAEGHQAMVHLLLRGGCGITAQDGVGRCGLHWAAVANQPRIVRLLVDLACKAGSPDSASAFVRRKDKFGKTAGDLARIYGPHEEVMTVLRGYAR